jgi:CHAD domain-containing protein
MNSRISGGGIYKLTPHRALWYFPVTSKRPFKIPIPIPDAKSPPRALHRLRIDCKKLRYLLEFFISLYKADDTARIIKPLKRLQDNLGTFNDLDVQEHALLHFTDELGAKEPEDCRLAMGHLIALLQSRAREQRRRLKRRLAEFRKASRLARMHSLLGGHSRG